MGIYRKHGTPCTTPKVGMYMVSFAAVRSQCRAPQVVTKGGSHVSLYGLSSCPARQKPGAVAVLSAPPIWWLSLGRILRVWRGSGHGSSPRGHLLWPLLSGEGDATARSRDVSRDSRIPYDTYSRVEASPDAAASRESASLSLHSRPRWRCSCASVGFARTSCPPRMRPVCARTVAAGIT